MSLKTIKTVLWSAIGGAFVWWIVLGFGFGWMSAGTAEQQAGDRATTAVLDALAPICVERFQQDAESEAKLKTLEEASTWSRADFIVKQGWAAMPGNDLPETLVAKTCASQILAAKRS